MSDAENANEAVLMENSSVSQSESESKENEAQHEVEGATPSKSDSRQEGQEEFFKFLDSLSIFSPLSVYRDISTGMGRYPHDFLVQERGLKAIELIIAHTEYNSLYLANNGAIHLVCRSMKNHERQVSVQITACGILKRLAQNVDNHGRISKADGIELMCCAMKNFPSNTLLQLNICAALDKLADSEDIRTRLCNCNGGELLKQVIRTNSHDAAVMHFANSTITKLHSSTCCVS
eukprot:TRINITY_DN9499_c0_g1_i1.p1 TRINITY_DN9499_c0_g1~~TRINITY_DN9499_c0_g1_i1.p1  ORF type:complete len:234 (-),score=4.98 TRINITY_DN9499_c0_g1_i1:150-851(-)